MSYTKKQSFPLNVIQNKANSFMGLKEKCNPITLEHISMDIEKEKAQAERISLHSIYAQIKSWKPFP